MNIFDINVLKNSKGQVDCTVEQLKEVYLSLQRPKARVVKLYKNYFISFKSIPDVQFKINESISREGLGFIESKIEIDATKDEENMFKFVINEFTQGKNFSERLGRFVSTSIPLVLLNMQILMFSTNKSMESLLTGILASVSIFVAIFSLFTVSHEYLERKKLSLFMSGKLANYFSVDRNMAQVGITAILCSLFALLIVNEIPGQFWNTNNNLRGHILLLLINISFFATYIILRSVIEFYIHRPAKYILGDMKKEYLQQVDND